MPFNALEATIESIHKSLFTGQTTCREIVSAFLSRIEAFNHHINAIISLNPQALDIADDLDKYLASGKSTGPLFCIPILLKDNFDTADMPTTGGNLALSKSQPTKDAPAVIALKNAGAIILGKTNLHEFALEGISVSSLGGQTINPYDFTRTPGGSSGGTGAAIAASFAVLGTGSDTVNSLRNPASANSLFSVRPTKGLISRTGIMPCSWTQDTVGPVARCVKDLAVALTVMASSGYDECDNTTALVPPSYRNLDYVTELAKQKTSLKSLRLGILNTYFNRTPGPETDPVNQAMDKVIAKLKAAGTVLVDVEEDVYNTTKLAELDTQRWEFGGEMDRYLSRSTLGGANAKSLAEIYNTTNTKTTTARNSTSTDSHSEFLVLPSQYPFIHTALQWSTTHASYASNAAKISNLTTALATTFTKHNLDAIIYPEQRNLVVKLGAPSQAGRNGHLAALTGSPVVCVPVGFSEGSESAKRGVPVGMEILGRAWSEGTLLGLAEEVDRVLGGGRGVRRAPGWAEKRVDVKKYERVPEVRPNRQNIPREYPVGVV
ncbi:amidase signature enzyme [Delitschia confertaspora ATCC 74209]|uniref:Amidase signature enzyme n=1 Tax=Delitschia confertaspora ATCC 74209 TaxID=1513339 RepID=A0A9P4JN07_9PLEO|nr:amidase signature enzyme [Delitschia confertaspora ATCC 74209]